MRGTRSHTPPPRLASTSAVTDNYYVGSTIAITGGPGVGASTRITAYCGLSHTSCEGMDSSGTIQAVTFDQKEMTLTNTLQTRGGYPSSLVNVASILKVRLPSVDGSGKSVAAGGAAVTTCATAVVPPYMNSYTGADCTGTYVGRNIYISRGTGSGQVGLIRAGPDANRDVLVTGLLGYCSGGLDSLACLDDWHYGEQNCQANMGSRCVHDGDCTGGPNARCVAPVDTTSEYTISHSPISSTCNPLCNGVASYTATVDLATTFTLTSSSTYSISRVSSFPCTICHEDKHTHLLKLYRSRSKPPACGTVTIIQRHLGASFDICHSRPAPGLFVSCLVSDSQRLAPGLL